MLNGCNHRSMIQFDYRRLSKFEMPTGAYFLLAVNIIFLAMIIAGFVRFRKPESGQLLIAGFIGLAISVIFDQIYSSELSQLIRVGGAGFDFYVKWYGPLETIAVLLPVIILFILFLVGLVFRGHKYSGEFMLNGGVGAIIALVVVGVIAPSWIKLPDKSAEAEVEYYTHTIQIALEMYAQDYGGLYPDHIEAIIDGGYLAAFPENPFTNQPMKNVPYGSPDFEGNFTYLPVKLEIGISGYILLGYGYKTTIGECLLDPEQSDHVIIILSSGSEYSLGPDDISSPLLQDAIRSSQQ
jgi:hypothetical protein